MPRWLQVILAFFAVVGGLVAVLVAETLPHGSVLLTVTSTSLYMLGVIAVMMLFFGYMIAPSGIDRVLVRAVRASGAPLHSDWIWVGFPFTGPALMKMYPAGVVINLPVGPVAIRSEHVTRIVHVRGRVAARVDIHHVEPALASPVPLVWDSTRAAARLLSEASGVTITGLTSTST